MLGIEELPGSPIPVLAGFVLAAVLFAALWSRHFERGPLEYLLNTAVRHAARLP
ncbi:DUF418 domain-containing protein [Kitasatospora sp. Root107]|uniref:DUF418 domain-containing protein n=1 Tax=Kitasatospora sp. Root107 TaxID=1736424 RepID=UPI000ACC624B|nr:DUF418 domain-containing protein [Kitasatospora sp. Root107]